MFRFYPQHIQGSLELRVDDDDAWESAVRGAKGR